MLGVCDERQCEQPRRENQPNNATGCLLCSHLVNARDWGLECLPFSEGFWGRWYWLHSEWRSNRLARASHTGAGLGRFPMEHGGQ